jgi:hypothetical protein
MAYARTPGVTPYGQRYEIISVPWTSDGSGNYTETVTLNGWLVKSVTDPGSTAPTDNYDITLVQNTADQLAGALVDRDTANGETVIHAAPILLVGDHTFTVANAGSAKVGTAYFYLVESL